MIDFIECALFLLKKYKKPKIYKSDKCVICYGTDNEIKHIYINCGHQCICTICFPPFLNSVYRYRCMICMTYGKCV